MALINTTHGEMDEADLIKTEQSIDTDVERTTAVEYCVAGCEGEAHRTGIAQGDGCFCPHHVHRSVDMYLKQSVIADGLAAMLG